MSKNAPRAEKGCLKGVWKAKFALKRVTLFGQIWFAFSFMGLEKGFVVLEMGQSVLKGARKASKRLQKASKCLTVAQNGSRWVKMVLSSTGQIKVTRFS